MVPEGWEIKKLKSLCKKVIDNRGKTPSLSDQGKPLIEINSIIGNKFPDLSKVTKFVSDETFNTWFRNGHPEKGDVLVATVGNTGVNCIVDFEEGVASIAQNLIGLRFVESIDCDFMYYNMNTSNHFSKVKSVVMGAVQPSLKVPHLLSFEYNIPPLPEQKKIAQILSTWDNAISATERLLENSQQRKKALMQQLLTGKKRLPGFEGEWNVNKLEAVMKRIYGGGTPPREDISCWNGDLPWVTVKDLVSDRITGAQEHISDEGLRNSAANIVEKGNVIIATRMAVGRVVTCSVDVAINQDLKAIIPNEKAVPDYIFYWFKYKESEISKLGTGSTVKGIQLSDLKKLTFLTPPISEQKKIAEILTTADKEIDALQKRLGHLKQEKKALMQQLLTGKRRVQVDAAA